MLAKAKRIAHRAWRRAQRGDKSRRTITKPECDNRKNRIDEEGEDGEIQVSGFENLAVGD